MITMIHKYVHCPYFLSLTGIPLTHDILYAFTFTSYRRVGIMAHGSLDKQDPENFATFNDLQLIEIAADRVQVCVGVCWPHVCISVCVCGLCMHRMLVSTCVCACAHMCASMFA